MKITPRYNTLQRAAYDREIYLTVEEIRGLLAEYQNKRGKVKHKGEKDVEGFLKWIEDGKVS